MAIILFIFVFVKFIMRYDETKGGGILNNSGIEARRAYQRAWRKKNPDRVKAIQARYWEKKAEEMNKKLKADADKED